MKKNDSINVALVDDHSLFRKGVADTIRDLNGFSVLFEANNGKDFIEKLSDSALPDIVLLDIEMKIMDGYETAQWINKHHPQMKILALSMFDDDKTIIRMIQCGAKGYILKDNTGREELYTALSNLQQYDIFYPEQVNKKMINGLRRGLEQETDIRMTEREREFLVFASTELTYKEIADRMHVAPRTVEGYREDLFEKLNVKNRVGLVLYAIRNKIVIP